MELRETFEEKVARLTPLLKQEVEDFMDFLLEKKRKKSSSKPDLNWFGGLKEFKDRFTSVELQHKANEWRI